MNPTQPTDPSSANVRSLLQAGIAAAKAGQRPQARELLLQVIALEETNVTAWLWLSGLVESRTDKEACLENVLTLDPNNEAARQGLLLLQKNSPPPASPPTPPPATPPARPTSTPDRPSPQKPAPPPPARPADPLKPGHLRQHASIAASVLQPNFTARQKPVDPAERDAPEDVFANEYLCPYCAKRTQPRDSRCPTCHKGLWMYVPRRAKPSKLYYFFMWNIIINVVIALFSVVALVSMGMEDRSLRNSDAFYILLGLRGFDLTTYTVILIGYFKRWRILYYLNVLSAILLMGAAGLVAFVFGLNSASGIVCGGGIFFLSIFWFFMILNLGDDFAYDKYRLVLRVDPDVKTAKNLYHRGNHYSQRGMWALAAMHFRRAAGQSPDDINCHLALALAYLRLNLLDKAAEALAEARRISTIDPLLEKLTLELEQKRRT